MFNLKNKRRPTAIVGAQFQLMFLIVLLPIRFSFCRLEKVFLEVSAFASKVDLDWALLVWTQD